MIGPTVCNMFPLVNTNYKSRVLCSEPTVASQWSLKGIPCKVSFSSLYRRQWDCEICHWYISWRWARAYSYCFSRSHGSKRTFKSWAYSFGSSVTLSKDTVGADREVLMHKQQLCLARVQFKSVLSHPELHNFQVWGQDFRDITT